MPNVPSDVAPAAAPDQAPNPQPVAQPTEVVEVGGPPGPEPTRFGDWEKNGRCVDF